MEKAKRLAAQFLVFMFWSAVMTAACLIFGYGAKYNSFPPVWRWWDVLGISLLSAAIIMTGKSVFKKNDKFREWGASGIFTLPLLGLFWPQASVWILGKEVGPVWLFLAPSGLGIVLIAILNRITGLANRAVPWMFISVWTMSLIFIFSLSVAQGFYFVVPHLRAITRAAIAAIGVNIFVIIAMVLAILAIKGLVILHKMAFPKPKA